MSLAIKGIETDNCKKKGGNFVCKTYKDLMTQHTKNSPVAGRVAEPDSWPAQCLIEKRIVHLKGTVGAVNCLQLHLSMRFTSEHLFVLESTEDDLPANCLLLRLHKKAGQQLKSQIWGSEASRSITGPDTDDSYKLLTIFIGLTHMDQQQLVGKQQCLGFFPHSAFLFDEFMKG